MSAIYFHACLCSPFEGGWGDVIYISWGFHFVTLKPYFVKQSGVQECEEYEIPHFVRNDNKVNCETLTINTSSNHHIILQ